MSPLNLSHRFKTNPWPWLIGVLLLILSFMLITEYERSKALPVVKNEWALSLHPPTFASPSGGRIRFRDPFGNYYDIRHGRFSGFIKPPSWLLLLRTQNIDRSAARTLMYTSQDGFSSMEHQPANDIVLPFLFTTLLLTFTILWFRNAKQRRIPQP